MPRMEGERLKRAETRQEEDQQAGSLPSRLGWFVLLWLASVAVLGVVAYGIRLMIL